MSLIVLRWATFAALSYLYYRFLTQAHSEYDLIFALRRADAPQDTGYRHTSDHFEDYYDKVTLTEDEEARVILEYSRIDRGI